MRWIVAPLIYDNRFIPSRSDLLITISPSDQAVFNANSAYYFVPVSIGQFNNSLSHERDILRQMIA